nr:LysR substrate-binding domain-containing protein [Cupriavidus oxalaticus]
MRRAGLPARRGTPRTPHDLARHDCLVLVGSQGRQDVWRLGDGQGGEIAVRVRGRIEANTGELLADAALAGFGIALHSTSLAQEYGENPPWEAPAGA